MIFIVAIGLFFNAATFWELSRRREPLPLLIVLLSVLGIAEAIGFLIIGE